MTEGLNEMLANLRKLEVQNRAAARRAVTEVAETFAENLEANTPEDSGVLASDVTVTGFKGGSKGLLEKDIGYGKGSGFRARFPDTGTINQRPQNFIERTINQTTPTAQQIFVKHIKEGLKL